MWDAIKELTGWESFAYGYIAISIVANLIFSIVVIIGGAFDLSYLFKSLSKETDELHSSQPEEK